MYRSILVALSLLSLIALADEIKGQQKALNHMLYKQHSFGSDYSDWAATYIRLIQSHLPSNVYNYQRVCRVTIQLHESGLVHQVRIVPPRDSLDESAAIEYQALCNDVVFAVQSISQFPMPPNPDIAKKFMNISVAVSPNPA